MNTLQRTDTWFKEREGKLTASSFGQAAGLAPGSRQQLWRRHFNLEVFEGNEATQWGEENEPVALSAYSRLVLNGQAPTMAGFVPHPEHEWLGGSPDLLVGDDGMGEIKCPFNQKIYPDVPLYYMAQVQGLLQITNRLWCDFIVWTPEQMSVRRVHRSAAYWEWLHVRLADYWTWVCASIEPPREKKKLPPPSIVIEIDDERIFNLQGDEQ